MSHDDTIDILSLRDLAWTIRQFELEAKAKGYTKRRLASEAGIKEHRLKKYLSAKPASRSKNARILELYRALWAMGIPPAEFMARVFCLDGNPLSELQRALDEENEPSSSAELDFFAEKIKRREVLPVSLPEATLDPRLAKIGDLRDSGNTAAALDLAAGWVTESWPDPRLFRRDRRRYAEKLGSYTSAIGAWASSVRAGGNPTLAASALRFALAIPAGDYDSLIAADLCHRAGVVLRDLGLLAASMRMHRLAFQTFSLLDADSHCVRSLLGLSVAATYAMNTPVAIRALKKCQRYSLSALQHQAIQMNHAYLEIQQGQPDAAIKILTQLLADSQLGDKSRVKAEWRLAVAECQIDPLEAESLFPSVLEEARRHLQPHDVVLIFLDYARFLSITGDHALIASRASSVIEDVRGLNCDRLARSIVLSFFEKMMTVTGHVTEVEISKTEASLKDALGL